MEKRSSHDYRKYYENLEVKGNGAFGIVYKGREIKSKELRAIKIIQLDKLKGKILSNIKENEDSEIKYKLFIDGYINECENMKLCSNINSVKYYEYFKDENNFVIIMELCDNNLLELLLKKGNEGFCIEEIYEIMKQLNNGLKIMREYKIIFRDLKLENILIKYKDNNKYIIKLADYGISKRINSLSKNYCNTNAGTLEYIAPEILKGENYNYKCDLWSIGIMIYKLKFIKSPFNGEAVIALINNIINFNNNIIKKTGNEELDDLIKRLLEKDYPKRLNWDEYFNHPFFHPFSKKINLVYFKKWERDDWKRDNNIFGEKFVNNNKNNIELKINGIKSELVEKCKLEYGENNIEIIIKNKITNFEYMFFRCISLKSLEGLRNLDVLNGNNFSYIFYECESLTDIQALENWNVSNGNDFSYMFNGCKSLSDIKALKNWNVSNGINFNGLFSGCESLSDIKPLENWNVSNGNDFSYMFYLCKSLSDIKALENWNVSNGNNFNGMFKGCKYLLNRERLENWSISKNEFNSMFNIFEPLSESLGNKNASNENDFFERIRGYKDTGYNYCSDNECCKSICMIY